MCELLAVHIGRKVRLCPDVVMRGIEEAITGSNRRCRVDNEIYAQSVVRKAVDRVGDVAD